MAARILIVSPIPSHPQNQGNSARIFALGRALQGAGFLVHFLYVQNEGLDEAQWRDMEACWDRLHLLAATPRESPPTGDGFYCLDDWEEPALPEFVAALHRRWRFSAVIANYVWFSRVLESFGGDVLKILDTHDVFGDRHVRFRELGLKPEWFWTTPEEEARGLARADIVLAIQEEEAAQFVRLGHPDVRVIGHLIGRRARRLRAVGVPRIGYLASGNPLNVDSFETLRQNMQGLPAHAHFVLAGTICARVAQPATPFEMIGTVAHLDDFYDEVDVLLNPMSMGTGLKIKSVEAVFEGLPLVATRAAMTGLPAEHPLHLLANAAAVAEVVTRERFDLALRQSLADASASCARRYTASVRERLASLVRSLRRDV